MKKDQTTRVMAFAFIFFAANGALVSAFTEAPAAKRQVQKQSAKASDRILRKEVIVPGTLAQVWHCWTTEEGIAKFFSPESKIELKPGGAYYIYMMKMPPGKKIKRGTEGCKLLSYIPHEMLAFEWNFPPAVSSLRESGAMTQVVLKFEDLSDGTVKVKFAQLGWKKGEDWDKGYAYFDNAWSRVLDQLKNHLEKEKPTQARSDSMAAGKVRVWTDGHVKVTAIDGPEKRQDFEMELPVAVEKVWNLLATTNGIHKLGSKDGVVELKPGGTYSFWPGAPNKVLAFVQQEMLSVSGSAPPKFPNVRQGGTWSAYSFDRLDDSRTRLRLAVIGWRPGEKEWDDAYDYFLKNNPVFLNSVYDTLTKKNSSADAGEALRHEGIVDAPVADVWAAFATKEGQESWNVAHAEIDLHVGGKMLTQYDPKGVIGDENTIENTILSYEPLRMFSIKATHPPVKFPFKNALKKMWTVVYFEPVGSDRTRLTICGMGFDDDEESRKMRELFDRGNAYTLRKLQEHFAKSSTSDEDAETAAPGAASGAPRSVKKVQP